MSVENATTIYATLLDRFESEIPIPKTVRWQKSKFVQFITNHNTPMCLLVLGKSRLVESDSNGPLDEMDQLSSKNEKVLYDLFELAGEESSKLIIVGIANGLDLLERVLPNLSKHNKPKRLNFQPYKTEQIETLIKVLIDF